MACENYFHFLQPVKIKPVMLLISSFSFAAINQESLPVVQVTLIKMRGQSVESLQQVGAWHERVCVGLEPKSRVMNTAVNQVKLISLYLTDLNGVTKNSCWMAAAVMNRMRTVFESRKV